MASLQQHMKDCEHFLGAPFEEVNRWLDEFMPKVGANHRRFRHHREGIKEAGRLFGEAGAKAAIVHILRDCRNIPTANEDEIPARAGLEPQPLCRSQYFVLIRSHLRIAHGHSPCVASRSFEAAV
jgi:hypothetical protein